MWCDWREEKEEPKKFAIISWLWAYCQVLVTSLCLELSDISCSPNRFWKRTLERVVRVFWKLLSACSETESAYWECTHHRCLFSFCDGYEASGWFTDKLYFIMFAFVWMCNQKAPGDEKNYSKMILLFCCPLPWSFDFCFFYCLLFCFFPVLIFSEDLLFCINTHRLWVLHSNVLLKWNLHSACLFAPWFCSPLF